MLDLLGLYLILSTTFTLGKAALQVCSPIAFVGLRMVASGLLILFFCRMTGVSVVIRGWQDSLLFLRVAFFHVYTAYVLEFWALSKLDSALVALLYNLSPFITALLSYAIYGEQFSRPKLVGLVFGFAGLLIPLLYGKSVAAGVGLLGGVHSLALIALTIAVVSACYGWLLVKNLVVHHRYSPYVINGWSMLVGGIGATITAFFLESYPFISGDRIEKSTFYKMILIYMPAQHASIIYTIACLIGSILVSNVLFYNFYGHLLKKYSPTLLSFAGFTMPLCTALLGYFYFSEPIGGTFLLSMLCMSIGLIIFYKNEFFSKKKGA